jgi:hypothetical protein
MTQRLLIFSIAIALLSSCGVDSKHFKLEGRLLNMNQGELYLYSDNDGVDGIDTIKIEGGRFVYEMACEKPAAMVLVFPNYSELPIYAEPGKSVDLDGDASHLKELKLDGSKPNKLMSDFREQIAKASPPEIRAAARRMIEDHPDWPLGSYLLKKYFVATSDPDYREATRLLQSMKQAQPRNGELVTLGNSLTLLSKSMTGAPLPTFTAYDLKGRLVSSSDLTSGVAVITSWASWSYDSMNMLRQLKQLLRSKNGRFKVVSVSADAGKTECMNAIRYDSLSWPVVCDGKMLEGKPLQQLGLTVVPGNIVVKNGRIVARNLSVDDLKKKIEEIL